MIDFRVLWAKAKKTISSRRGRRRKKDQQRTERSTEYDVTRENQDDRSRSDSSEAELASRSQSGGEEGVDGGDDDSEGKKRTRVRIESKWVKERKRRDELEEGRVEIVLADGNLDEDEDHSEGDGDETVDEGSVESRRLNEG